jgi:hypothetical protein
MTLTTRKRCLLSTLALLLLSFLSIVSAHEQSSTHYTIPKDVLSNGGDKSKSPNYKMVATVGQYATRKGTANGKVLYSGFYAPRSTRSPKSNSGCGGVTEGLVACYPFDGNANDASGNGNHGIVAGGVGYAEGKMGQAAQFNGKNGVVTATLPKVKKTYSVSMFVKLNSNNKVENQLFYLTRKNAIDRLGYLSTYPIGKKKIWHFGSRRYGKGWEDRGTAAIDPEGMLINKWSHLVFILNDKEISLYVNGKLLKTIESAYESDIEAHSNLLFLVGGTTEKYQWMDGLIDEVRIYNRALTESEIKQLYNPACGGITEGLVACYPFDGNANDASGNGNHGIVAGGAGYAEGKIGQAAQFNGKNGVVTATLPKVKKTYSVSMFVKLNSNNKVENQLFYLTRKNAIDRLGYLSTYPIGKKKIWHFGSRRYGKGWEDRGTAAIDPEGMLINKWSHLVFILNDKEISLYVNGKLLKTIESAYESDIEAHSNLLFLVGGTTEKYQWMDGLIDEVRIYNRALTESEIKQLYTGEEEPCEPELSVQPFYRVLQWWQIQTPFELQDKADCGDMNWTTQANQPWLSVSPSSGTDDASLNVMMYPSWWFNVGTFTTTAPDAIGSPANNLVIQPGLWWWWRYWVMQLFSGRIHPSQAIPHLIGIHRIMHGPMIFRVRWPGSDLDLKITTPSGKTLTQDSPEVLKVYQGDTEEYWVVESQEQGDWQVEVVAIEVDAEGEDYQLEIIANERTEPPTEDTDGDGLADEWEQYFLGDLTQEGTDDSDNDGVPHWQEFQEQMNPMSGDTDGDGKSDLDEIPN